MAKPIYRDERELEAMLARKKSVTMTMPRELVNRLDELADEHNTTRSEIVTNLCIDALGSDAAMIRLTEDPKVWNAFMRTFASPGVVAAMVEAMRTDDDADPHQLAMFTDAVKEAARHQLDHSRDGSRSTPSAVTKKPPTKKPATRKAASKKAASRKGSTRRA